MDARRPPTLSAWRSLGAASTKMLGAPRSAVARRASRQAGKPLEVMGILLGYPDADSSKRRLVVTDALPLPVTGFEPASSLMMIMWSTT